MHFTATLVSLALQATHILAQCEAPVPCQDPILNALNTTDCQTYHAFLARGSDSGYPGHLGRLIRRTCEILTGNDSPDPTADVTCGYENIIYPANSSYAGKEMWCLSAAKGAAAGQQQMKEYAERCPHAKLILMGFSQGASVALDVLGGGGGPVFQCVQSDNDAVDPESLPGSQVVAAAVFGAARRTAHQSYTLKGGKDYNGTAPRNATQLASLNAFADEGVLREWCNTGDPICAVGSSPIDVNQHLNYFDLYNEEAAQWVVRAATGNQTEGLNLTAPATTTTTTTSTAKPSKTPTKTSAGANKAKATGVGEGSGSANAQGSQKESGAAILSMAVGALAVVGATAFLLL